MRLVKYPGDPLTHYWLFLNMGRILGVDIQNARDKGRLKPEDFSKMLDRCRRCAWEHEGGCTYWQRMDCDGAEEPPRGCVNRKWFLKQLRLQERFDPPAPEDNS